jgi:hypothetical protein
MARSMVVLAAGMGSRYGGLKQLDQLGPTGETIIDYSVFDARRAGIDKVVFVIRREFETEFRERVAASYERHLDVHYAFQEIPAGRGKPWGTAHALLAARDAVGEPFLVINADDFYGADAYAVGAAALDAMAVPEVQVGMVAYPLQNTLSANGTVSRGLCAVAPNGALEKITETHGLAAAAAGVADESGQLHPPDTVASMNFWLMNAAVMQTVDSKFEAFATLHAADPKAEFGMPTVVNELVAARACTVQVHRSSARWSGVTYREDAEAVTAQLAAYAREGAYPQPLWG